MTTKLTDPQEDPNVVLRVGGISKAFGGTTALRDADLEIRRGEIHALLGGNGSGKSTLIKILAGVYTADEGGWIEIEGQRCPTEAFTPARAKEAGLHFVHQALGVFPSLTVAENLTIGRGYETRWGKAIRWHDVRARADRLLRRFHIQASPDTLVARLRPADRSLVAIARALQDQDDATRGVLILDEPTASLPAAEVEALLDALRRYAAAGQTIVFVSHRLDEVLSLADRVSVLRDGRRVGSVSAAGIGEPDLILMMFGRAVERTVRERQIAADGSVALEVRHLSVGPLTDVSMRVRRGEVVGVAGLLGTGRSELLHALFGVMPQRRGEILIDGRPVAFHSPRQAMHAGVALVPEDRMREAAFSALSVRENLSAGSVGQYWRRLRLRHGDERADAEGLIRRHGIQPPSCDLPFAVLSGGNQQKAVLARWLTTSPRILLLDEPTQGVDVGARAEIHALVRRVAADGNAVLVVSSDFEELAEVSDRAVVLAGGRVVGEAAGADLSVHRLTELCYGGQPRS